MKWFRIHGKDARVEEVGAPHRSAVDAFGGERRQGEDLLYAVLAVAPGIIDAAGEVPVWLSGDQSNPDLAFVDSTGRLTIVECKKHSTKAKDLVQLLGYGYVETASCTPTAELALAFGARKRETYGVLSALAIRSDARAVAQRCLTVSKASSLDGRVSALDDVLGVSGATASLGETVGSALFDAWPEWPNRTTIKVCDAWGRRKETFFSNAPPRLVLVAPSFNDETRELAEQLGARGMWIDLVALDVRLTPAGGGLDDVYVGLADGGQRCDGYHWLWDALRITHAGGEARRLQPVGLSCLAKPGDSWRYPMWSFEDKAGISVSLSADRSGDAELFVRLAHGAFDGGGREQMQGKIRAALRGIGSPQRNRGDYTWGFRLPDEQREWTQTFAQVCEKLGAITTDRRSSR